MAAPAPPRQPMLITKPSHGAKPGGVLPVQSTPAKGASTAPAKQAPKNVTARLKVIIRRLPPGLTEAEFAGYIGDEWKVGPRVDWLSYMPGKISKDPAKPSRPSRAYLHLTKQEHLGPLSEKVRSTTFVDAKNSGNDSSVLGPATLEFAPYGRVPTSKVRKDGRQGTIDQDQDFIDFLQELTNPITKPTPVDSLPEKATKTEEKIVTPLIQYLRDKKANKGKDTGSGKSGKHGRQESKEGKSASISEKKAVKSKETANDKKGSTNSKAEKASKDSIKVLNKQASAKNAAASSAPSSASTPPAATPARPERKRERGNASAAAKILQRDLGLNGGAPGRRRRENSTQATPSSTPANAKENTPKSNSSSAAGAPSASSSSSTASTPSTPAAAKATQAPAGPAASRQQQRSSPAQAKAPAAPAVTPTATQAFLKHANPSQGVTEPLLQEAFASFGTVSRVEIDKKKGFAYIDFAEPESLQKAVAASPIKVAQGQVVVLERKTGVSLQNRNAKNAPPTGPSRGGSANARGGRGRGRGGKAGDASSNKSTTGSAASTPNTAAPKPTASVDSGPPP